MASWLDLLGVLTSLGHTGVGAPVLCARCARRSAVLKGVGGQACALVVLLGVNMCQKVRGPQRGCAVCCVLCALCCVLCAVCDKPRVPTQGRP